MRKLKTGLVLVLALCLLILGACLPAIVALIQDSNTQNRTGSSDIAPISLNLIGSEPTLTMVEKMRLIRDGNTFSITEEDTQISAAEALAYVDQYVEEYVAAELFPWFKSTHYEVVPTLSIDRENPEKYGIFWVVYIADEEKSSQSLIIILDDETGTLLSISYDNYDSNYADRTALSYRMETLIDIYLRQSGLALAATDVVDAEPDIEAIPGGDETTERLLALTDSEGNEIVVSFFANKFGSFSIIFPQ